MNYFDEYAEEFCGNCDVCLASADRVDVTQHATMMMELIRQTNEKFGSGYIVDLVWGSASGRMQAEHKLLPLFGAGSTMTKSYWNDLLEQLIAENYLTRTKGVYPTIKVTQTGLEAINKQQKIQLTQARKKRDADIPVHQELLSQLKIVRRELAAREKVPSYIVLSDASISELAIYLPQNVQDLRKISGFGNVKIEKYGDAFCQCIVSYCETHNIPSQIHLKQPKERSQEKPEKESETKKLTLKLFQQGHTVEEIATIRNLTLSTIEGHLSFYIQQGQLSAYELVDLKKLEAIQQAIESAGSKMLTPIKDQLGDAYSFTEIRYVIAHMQHNKLLECELQGWGADANKAFFCI